MIVKSVTNTRPKKQQNTPQPWRTNYNIKENISNASASVTQQPKISLNDCPSISNMPTHFHIFVHRHIFRQREKDTERERKWHRHSLLTLMARLNRQVTHLKINSSLHPSPWTLSTVDWKNAPLTSLSDILILKHEHSPFHLKTERCLIYWVDMYLCSHLIYLRIKSFFSSSEKSQHMGMDWRAISYGAALNSNPPILSLPAWIWTHNLLDLCQLHNFSLNFDWEHMKAKWI